MSKLSVIEAEEVGEKIFKLLDTYDKPMTLARLADVLDLDVEVVGAGILILLDSNRIKFTARGFTIQVSGGVKHG